MNPWIWFCQLGCTAAKSGSDQKEPAQKSAYGAAGGQKAGLPEGLESYCTMLQGQGCQCGNTFRSLRCVWSHYRKP